MIARVGLLIGGTLLFWLLAVGLAPLLGVGEPILLTSAAAMGICLIPAILTLAITERAAQNKPETVGLTFLAGTLFRMGIVLALALVARSLDFFRHQDAWLTWVVVFYLVVLALETALIVVGRTAPPAA